MTIHLSITIDASAERVFHILTDLPSYPTWLTQSGVFKGTEVSETPVKLGTTYREDGPSGVRNGTIVEFDPPTKVAFSQPMAMKPYFLGITLGIRVDMRLREESVGEGADAKVQTVLEREINLKYPWVMVPIKIPVDKQFETESWRTLRALKVYAERSREE